MNKELENALCWYASKKIADKNVRTYLSSLAREAGLYHLPIRLDLKPSAWVDDNDFDKPRLTMSTIGHSPAVSIQLEPENATPAELRRLVPYLRSFPEPWERDMLKDAGLPAPLTARNVALPYESDDTPIVLFVGGFLVGRLPFGLTYEEAVDDAKEKHERALWGVR